MIKVGDTIILDGVQRIIKGRWAQGKHLAWQLENGDIVLDLHLVDEPRLTLVEHPVIMKAEKQELPKLAWDWEDIEE